MGKKQKAGIDIPLLLYAVDRVQWFLNFKVGIYNFRYGKRDIHKTGFAFEFGSNSKAQQDIERNMAVIPAFDCQGMREKICKFPSTHGKIEQGVQFYEAVSGGRNQQERLLAIVRCVAEKIRMDFRRIRTNVCNNFLQLFRKMNIIPFSTLKIVNKAEIPCKIR